MQKLIGDIGGEPLAVRARDHVQHQIDRRGAAAACQPVAVDAIEVARDRERRELVGECFNASQ